MGSHSVTCHSAEVRIRPLTPAEAGTRFSDSRGMCSIYTTFFEASNIHIGETIKVSIMIPLQCLYWCRYHLLLITDQLALLSTHANGQSVYTGYCSSVKFCTGVRRRHGQGISHFGNFVPQQRKIGPIGHHREVLPIAWTFYSELLSFCLYISSHFSFLCRAVD